MTRQELINEVKCRVDELSASDDRVVPFSIFNEKPVDTFIDNFLDECAREVLTDAPVHHLEGSSLYVSTVDNHDGSGYVMLPSNCIRVLEFKMKEWKRAVTVFAESGSAVALMQSNVYLRGGVCKPVCVLGHRSGYRVVEYYSVKKSHEVDRFVVVRVCPAEDVRVDLQPALTWFCASKVLQVFGRSDLASAAYERGKHLL